MAPATAKRSLHRQEALSATHNRCPLVVLTSGEPAGIGPDICAMVALEKVAARLAILGDPDTFAARNRSLGISPEIVLLDDLAATEPHRAGRMQIVPVLNSAPTTPGRLDPRNAAAVIRMLELAAGACITGVAAAMVTAPVQKSVIIEAGIPFTGHTELLGQLTGGRPVMLLASSKLRVALVTTHLPLAAVPEAITRDRLRETLLVVERDLRLRFGLDRPRILVLGLNPHAGENGALGTEEQTTIAPVIAELESTGLRIRGPASADSAFTAASLAATDVVVAMYHDQGLPVIKAQDFGAIVNVTLGLPIIRTSVDHGTALPLAGSGAAQHASLGHAIELALELAAVSR